MPIMVDDEVNEDDDVTMRTTQQKDRDEDPLDKEEREKATPKSPPLMKRLPPPFPQRLKKNTAEGKFKNFISMLKKMSIHLTRK